MTATEPPAEEPAAEEAEAAPVQAAVEDPAALAGDRLSVCKEAYEKLASLGGNLDAIAKTLDVSQVPEVVAGTAPAKDVYLKVMSLFTTQDVAGEVSWEEFCDVMGKVSAMVDSDDTYCALVKGMW